ncbi:sensor histidine kinase [Phormidium tenue FACHB-886]|nr:sensor histidine kinase [Phormidium tenue FACHB-886]
MNWINLLLKSDGFVPHGHCYLWQPDLVWLHVVSDLTIAFSYLSIPVTLLWFSARRKDLPFNWIFGLFGTFIILCGFGHLVNVWTLWHPTYYFSGVVNAMTAIVSLITALEMVSLVPKALALPSPAELETANHQLALANAQLANTNTYLDTSNRDLTLALERLKQTQSQLIQTEKMSALGHLVAGVAHEINNPVNFIQGNLIYATHYAEHLLELIKLYEQEHPNPSSQLEHQREDIDINYLRQDFPKLLNSMKLGAERIGQIVASLKNFSRLDESNMKSVDIHEGIDSTLLILQHRLKSHDASADIEVVKDFGQLPLVECLPGQINQVLMNLLSNAIDALECRRTRRVEGSNPAQEPPCIRITTSVTQDQQALIEITDNGEGMPESVREHIFNPFFTTKPIGKGTGLGLAISHQIIVEKHQGDLSCVSGIGRGTQFAILIPIRQACTLPLSNGVHRLTSK